MYLKRKVLLTTELQTKHDPSDDLKLIVSPKNQNFLLVKNSPFYHLYTLWLFGFNDLKTIVGQHRLRPC